MRVTRRSLQARAQQGHAGEGEWAISYGKLEDGALEGEVRRSRAGSTRRSFASARSEAVPAPVTPPPAAAWRPTKTAVASSSSSESGGKEAPAPSAYPPCDPSRGVDGIPETPQPFDVAPKRPRRHGEALRELAARPGRTRLEQRKKAEQAAGCLSMNRSLAQIEDRTCPQLASESERHRPLCLQESHEARVRSSPRRRHQVHGRLLRDGHSAFSATWLSLRSLPRSSPPPPHSPIGSTETVALWKEGSAEPRANRTAFRRVPGRGHRRRLRPG